jgi:hypothetical protein
MAKWLNGQRAKWGFALEVECAVLDSVLLSFSPCLSPCPSVTSVVNLLGLCFGTV